MPDLTEEFTGFDATEDEDYWNLYKEVMAFLEQESIATDKSDNLKKVKARIERQAPTISFLSHIMRIDEEEIARLLEIKKTRERMYILFKKPKRSGGTRTILAPISSLKSVQRKMLRTLDSLFIMPEVAFGGSSGSIQEAIEPHLEAKSLMRVDIKNAFPSISRNTVWRYFNHWINIHGPKRLEDNKRNIFSKSAAGILTDLTTHYNCLPQGAPTSPRMFDLVLTHLDKKLLHLAENVGGSYTRYVDNFFFSMPTKDFPPKIRQAILKLLENRGIRSRHAGPSFDWHKLSVSRVGEEAIRMLGLNIINKEIHNTRTFKRSLRAALRHVKWLRANNKDNEDAMLKLQGLMAFAQIGTLPKGLYDKYLILKKN